MINRFFSIITILVISIIWSCGADVKRKSFNQAGPSILAKDSNDARGIRHSVSINDNKEFTNKLDILLNIHFDSTWTSKKNVEMYITSAKDCHSGGIWEPLTELKEYFLGEKNQENYVYIKFRSPGYPGSPTKKESECVSDSIVHDNLSPHNISISINDNAKFADSVIVNLNLYAEEAQDMFVTNSPGCDTAGEWRPYLQSLEWEITSLGQSNNVYVKYRDKIGNESDCISAQIKHLMQPEAVELKFTDGQTSSKAMVNLDISAKYSSQMYLTRDPECSTGGRWEKYVTSVVWELKSANTKNSVYAKFKNEGGMLSECISAEIFYFDEESRDLNKPKGSFVIKSKTDDEVKTGEREVVLHLDTSGSTFPIDKVYLYGEINCAGEPFQYDFKETLDASLSVTETTDSARIFLKYEDITGNLSNCIYDQIIYDNSGPDKIGFQIDTEYGYTRDNNLELRFQAEDDYSRVTHVSINYGDACQIIDPDLIELNETGELSYPIPDGMKNRSLRVWVIFYDSFGNSSDCIDQLVVHRDVDIQPSITFPSEGSYFTTIQDYFPNINVDLNKDKSFVSQIKLMYKEESESDYFEIASYEVNNEENIDSLFSTKKYDGIGLIPSKRYHIRLDVKDKTGHVTTSNSLLFVNNPCGLYDDEYPGSWVFVPQSDTMPSFCVMKYEAKMEGGTPVSKADGTPWVDISQNEAKTKCASKGYRLISNVEWMRVAQDISTNQNNDSDWFTRGHAGLKACEASTNDAENIYNQNCQVDKNLSAEGNRVTYLSHGGSIWDIGGNVSELVDLQKDDSQRPIFMKEVHDTCAIFFECNHRWIFDYKDWVTFGSPTHNQDSMETEEFVINGISNLGEIYHSGNEGLMSLYRGGNFISSDRRGVFVASFEKSPDQEVDWLGFRCTADVPD